MVTPNATVADRVRDAITRASLSQRVVAKHAGIHQVTLIGRLMGRTQFKAEELLAIAILVGVDPARFLDGLNGDAS